MSLSSKHNDSKFHYLDGQYKMEGSPSEPNGEWHYIKNGYEKREDGWHPIWDYHWDVGPWGPCEPWCGDGTQTREVFCKRNDGISRPDIFCDGVEKPIQVQDCNAGPCNWPIIRFTADDYCGGVKIISGFPPLDGYHQTNWHGCYRNCCNYMMHTPIKPPTGTVLVIDIYMCDRRWGSSNYMFAAKSLGPTPLKLLSNEAGCCRGGGSKSIRVAHSCGHTVLATSYGARVRSTPCWVARCEVSVA